MTILIKPASSLCNMRCKYCFYANITENRECESYGIMSPETLENIVKKAFEYADDFVNFAFQGGEPTLCGLEFYRKLMKLESKYNIKKIKVNNAIQTNGYIIDEEWAKFFSENNFLVGLSIDGTMEIHDSMRVDAEGRGTYKKAINAAKLFDSYKVEYNILCVVNNFTARYPKKVYQNLKRFKYLQFIPCLDDFDGKKDKFSLTNERYANFLKVTFDEYYKDFISGNYVSVRNFDNYLNMMIGRPPESCAMNGFCACYFVIEGDGSVFPCDFYALDEWKIGDINSESFEEIRNSDTAKKFISVSINMNEKCKNCKWRGICRGGCRRDREPFENGVPGLNRLCESYEEFFTYAYDRMRELAVSITKKVT
ncbi:MAG: anaerobic sulfatase maturase [Oscillospiraceae bacterium]